MSKIPVKIARMYFAILLVTCFTVLHVTAWSRTCDKEKLACKKDEKCTAFNNQLDLTHTRHAALDVAKECMGNKICRDMYSCMDPCANDFLACVEDDECTSLLPEVWMVFNSADKAACYKNNLCSKYLACMWMYLSHPQEEQQDEQKETTTEFVSVEAHGEVQASRLKTTGLTATLTASVAVPQDTIQTALTFDGNGWYAHAAFTAFIEGLTKVASEREGAKTEATLKATNLLDRFDGISTSSGGTWFLAQLAYSKSFLSMVETGASDPILAGDHYIQNWVNPFLKASSVDAEHVSKFVSKFLGGVDQLVKLFKDPIMKGFKWDDFITNMLTSTSDLTADTRLGDDVNEWAKGKVWVAGTSMLTPGGNCSFCDRDATIWINNNDIDFAQYQLADKSKNQPLFTPASFSIKLGSGRQAPSALPYCAPAVCDSLTMTYNGGHFIFGPFKKKWWSDPITLSMSGYEEHAGALRVAQVASASSAAAGFTDLSDAIDMAKSAIGGMQQLSVWSSSSSAASFSLADSTLDKLKKDNRMTEETVNDLASKGMIGLVDAAHTDNTGIGHVISAGANEVVSFLTGKGGILRLCEREDDHAVMGGDGYGLTTFQYFQIFKESKSQIEDQIDKLDKVTFTDNKYLTSLKFGTLTVNTVNNAAFAIKAGRTIKIHVIVIDSSLSTTPGPMTSFKSYGTLVQEIVHAVAHHHDMSEKLLQFLLGK